MDEQSLYTDAGYAPAPIPASSSDVLLTVLLSDTATDVEVVTRELGLRNEMLERLRRALDRLTCAQAVLAAMSAGSMGTNCGETGTPMQMQEAVKLLAREWPEDYPAGAVEWLLLLPRGINRAVERDGHGT
ncbi:hypothetical protein SAMN02787142_3867 [Burkholderia sp. WP9]|nr:hypothetical protein SAMN02787142_3867 [Burkholderia sp. WP9]